VIVEQLQLMATGIREDELRRLKVQIRSGMIMQQESCRARARSIATDWSHLGRVRLLDEINDAINSLTVDSINEFFQAYTSAFGFFVRTGSRDETAAVGGVSHFLEHMVFKGWMKWGRPVMLVLVKKVRSTIRSCCPSFKRRWSSC